MNELLKINYEAEQPTVSARDLHEVQIRFEKAYEVTSWTHSRNYSVRCFWN